jgi:hypothetical protein
MDTSKNIVIHLNMSLTKDFVAKKENKKNGIPANMERAIAMSEGGFQHSLLLFSKHTLIPMHRVSTTQLLSGPGLIVGVWASAWPRKTSSGS